MASLEVQKGRYLIVFRHSGVKFQRTLETDIAKEALTLKNRLEENFKLLDRGRLEYSPGDDLVTLLLSEGKLGAPVKIEKRMTLGELFTRYQAIRLDIRTINEVRAERGYDPVPWGDRPLLQHGMHPALNPSAPGAGIDDNGNGQFNDKQAAMRDAQAELSDATGGAH